MALAMVGEALISASMEILLNKIAAREFRDFFSSRKLNVSLLDELKIKLRALNVVLNDAEEKQITDLEVKVWLDELKDVVFDAEDLLDEINAESLRCKVEGESKNFTTEVRSLLSSRYKKFYKSMNSKLEAISRRLEHFVNQKDILGLQSVSRRVSYRTATDSLVESVVVAREEDTEKLVNMLLSDDDDEKKNNIEVITILGMGGLGKTALAQSLYNDSEVQKHFDLAAWAWVSDDFDVFRVTKKIVESLTSKDCHITNLDVLRVELKNSLREKKFLLVLDDLWNDKYNDWDHLITPFSSGKKGSKIIVTTRQHRVAQVTHTFPICELKPLTDENCWCILARHAFGNEGYDKYPSLEEIGRKIARKCKGLPLAAKTVGGLLRSNVDAGEWNRILNSNLWAHDDVLPALRISYLHLPAHLKRCFAFCSIFPRKHLLDRKELILLWMAEGFLQQTHGEKAMESAGNDCFNELLSRSLIEKDETEVEEKFQMHDLIYDLARVVSGKSSCYFEGGEILGTIRHLAYLTRWFDVSKRFEDLYELNCLRTFLPRPRYPNQQCYLTKTVSHTWLAKQRYLRVLSLSEYKNINELPDSLGNFVLLRYLDLSNTSIKRLPDATFLLYNLQTLKLSNCKFLVKLPGQIGNLVNLRHLDISDTYLEMPTQICKLQNLHTLTSFVVGKQDGLRIRELRRFPYLQGKLSILELQNVVDPKDAFQAELKRKEQIEELMLEWGSDPQDAQIVKVVLENLQPSTNLKKLNIRSYGGTEFPTWLGDSSYSNLTVLSIRDCNYCSSLPPFGQLPSLTNLVIKRMKMVNKIGEEFYSSDRGSPSFQPFPLLENLEFEEMLEWKEWLPLEFEGSNFPFPCLKHLSLSKCPKLRGNLPNPLPSLRKVSISECNQLEAKSYDLHWNTSIDVMCIKEGGEGLLSLLDNFSYWELSIEKCDSLRSLPTMILSSNCLQDLNLTNISSLVSFPPDGLPASLRSLQIEDCRNLEFLSLETWHKCTSLEYLRIWDSCHSLTSFPLDCFPALRRLYIWFSPSLEAITTQGIGAAPKLVMFNVSSCEKLKSLTEQIDLPSLEDLWLHKLPELSSLSPRCLPSSLRSLVVDVGMLSSMSTQEFVFQFQRLTSLSRLRVWGFSEEDLINTMLKEQLLPISLQALTLSHFSSLKFLEGRGLHHLNSLRHLFIFYCRKLESLPEDQLPSSLELLELRDCPLLEARYHSPNGKYWSKIAHIPVIKINDEVIMSCCVSRNLPKVGSTKWLAHNICRL